jgi:hypothetical protein
MRPVLLALAFAVQLVALPCRAAADYVVTELGLRKYPKTPPNPCPGKPHPG